MSLRNIQQIDKLLVGEIQPRTNRNEFLSAGLILLTDNTGKANWTTISTLSRTYAQFTTISTANGIINAANSDTGINLIQTDGIGIQVLNESLVFKNTGLLAFDVSGSNMILGSNSSNGVVNNVVKFAGGKNTRLRADPGTNTLFFDTDLIVSSMGPRFSFTDIGLYQSRSNIEQNDAFESFLATNSTIEIFHANKAESLINIVGTGDLTVRGSNINNTVSIFLGLSTYNPRQFLEIVSTVTTGFPRLRQLVEQINFRQTVTTGVVLFSEFNPVSSLTSLTSRNLSTLSNILFSTLSIEHQQISSFSTFNLRSFNANLENINSLTGYINTLSTQNGFIDTLSTSQITTNFLIANNVRSLRVNTSSIIASTITVTTISTIALNTTNLSSSVSFLSSVIGRTVEADRFIGNGAAITNLTLPTRFSTVFLSTNLLEASSITSHDFKGVGSVNLLSTLRVSDFAQFNENVSISKQLNLSSLSLTGNALISSANINQISTGTITAKSYKFATGEDFTIKYNISTIVLNVTNAAYTPNAPNLFYCFSNVTNTGTIYQVFVGEPSLPWQNGDWIGLLINQFPENNNSYRFTSYFSKGSYWVDSTPLIGGKAVKLIYSAGSWSILG